MRHAHPKPLAALAAAMAARHVGRGPGFIDEDEALGVEIGLAVEPGLPALQDIRPILLAGVRGLFCA